MELFHRIEDGAAIIRSKGGKYAQVDVYRRGADVFIRHGGFVKVFNARGDTSVPSVTVLDLDAPGVSHTATGKLVFKG